MDNSAITTRYAKAFFSVAKEKDMLGTLKTDIELVVNVSSQSKDFMLLLESPIIKTSKKSAVIKSIFETKVNKLTLDFLFLIVNKKREIYIPGICRNFLDFTRKYQNIKSAVITTASGISTEIQKKVENLLSRELSATVELSSKVKPDIVGGLILRFDDKQYDASVATQLKKVKQTLLETEL